MADPFWQPTRLTEQASATLHGQALAALAMDDWLVALRSERRALQRRAGVRGHLASWADQVLHTQRSEYLDDAATPAAARQFLVNYIHWFNRFAGAYAGMARLVAPLAQAIAARQGRPARLLELACGAGEYSLGLALLAKQGALPVQVTGSDLMGNYVAEANARAAQRGLPVGFVVQDALAMDNLGSDAFDLVICAGSLHHFGAGQLAVMLQQARQVGAQAFVGIDGRRGPFTLLGLPVGGALSLRPWVAHDSTVSALKFYAEAELAALARRAVPEARVRVGAVNGWFSFVLVEW